VNESEALQLYTQVNNVELRVVRSEHRRDFMIREQPHQSCLDSPPHLLIHLSTTYLCHYPSPISSSFTLSLEAQNLPFQQNLPTLTSTSFTYWTAFMIMGLDRTYHAH